MIHSSVMDNWMRVSLMHSLAKEFYEKTRGGKYRDHYKNPGDVFFFDVEVYQNIDKERCIVGMLMAWSVITLEALVNHAIAETLQHKMSAVISIEFPNQLIDKLKNVSKSQSELAKKLIILSDNNISKALLDVADELADMRNKVVHDKPYSIVESGEGNFEVEHFRVRGETEYVRYTFDDLPEFYKKCTDIVDFINGYFEFYSIDGGAVDFRQLTSC